MNYIHQKNYWKRAAEHHKLIAHTTTNTHFGMYEPIMVTLPLKDMEYPCLLFEKPVEKLQDGGSDNIRNDAAGGILILQKASKSDAVDIQDAFDNTYAIACDMRSKMLNDRKKANQDGVTAPESMLKHLNLNTVIMQEVGPVFDSLFGWRIDYTFNSPEDLELNENNWLPDTETKFNYSL